MINAQQLNNSNNPTANHLFSQLGQSPMLQPSLPKSMFTLNSRDGQTQSMAPANSTLPFRSATRNSFMEMGAASLAPMNR